MAGTDVDDVVRELSKKMVVFLETGTAPEGLCRPDVFFDLSMPTWRIQVAGAEDLIGVRKQDHLGTSAVTRWRADPTPAEFEFEFEERWDHEGQEWYAQEMMRAEVADGQIAELVVYCTGDWDHARQAEHTATVTMIRR